MSNYLGYNLNIKRFRSCLMEDQLKNNTLRTKGLLLIVIMIFSFSSITAEGTLSKFDLNPGADGIKWPEFGNYGSSNILMLSVWINDQVGLVLSEGANENTKFLVEPDSSLENIVFDTGLATEFHFTDRLSFHTEVGFVFALINRGEETGFFRLAAGSTEMPTEPSNTIVFEATELLGSAGFTFYFGKRSHVAVWPNDVISLFSAAADGTNRELWKTDGSDAGTVLVKDINPGSAPSWPSKFTMVLEDDVTPWALQPRPISGALFFTADDGTGSEVWVTDATEAGTRMVKDIYASGGSYPYALTAMNAKLYFVAATQAENSELWVSDGTEAGTMMVKAINPGSAHSGILTLTKLNNTLYFRANNGTDYEELWQSDGTEAGTVMIKDINPTFGSDPFGFTEYQDKIYFAADDGVSGIELWVTDGTEAGTQLVKDINPGDKSSSPSHLVVFDEQLYFTADDGSSGKELWRTDGTETGTELVSDIYPGANSSFTNWYELMAVGDNLFFVADDGVIGHELMAYSNEATAVEETQNLPETFKLYQNYPNPFNPSTTISYSLPRASEVSLKIYNTLGQEIRSLVNSFQNSGIKAIQWDGRDNNGHLTTSGIYFYELVAGDYRDLRKAILLK